jgi:hypothetical protein
MGLKAANLISGTDGYSHPAERVQPARAGSLVRLAGASTRSRAGKS